MKASIRGQALELGTRLTAAAGARVSRWRPRPPGVVVLIYHSIAERGSSVTVPPARFEEQVRWLRHRYPILSLDEALALETIDRDAVVLTFDDGYSDYLSSALPILERYRLPSTVYVITEQILDPSRGYRFEAGRGKRSLDREELRDVARRELVTVGSHTHSHRWLPGLDAGSLAHELERSHAILAELLDSGDLHFCYPWGIYDRTTTAAVGRLYASAVTGRGGSNRPPLRPLEIRRTPVKNESLRLFAHRVRGHLRLEERLRWLKLRIRLTPGGADRTVARGG